MSSISSVRIPGLATGMDTDQMVKDMLIGEQNKIDKADQTQQVNKWKQEIYRDVIKDVKGLYDKYFSATSPNYILSSKVFSTITVNSSNSNIISATAGAGASSVNYKFKVDSMAQPPRIESGSNVQIDKNKTLSEQEIIADDGVININGKEIDVKATDKIGDVVKRINDSFPSGEVKAKYSEMTGKFTIEGAKTGESSTINVQGDFLNKMGMLENSSDGGVVNEIHGSNNSVTVKLPDGTEKVITEESNSFTIDNITYSVNGVTEGDEWVSMTSKTDTQGTVDKIKEFIDDYNKMVDKVYDLSTEKKDNDYPPLTEEQKSEMSKEEIERWEEKAKVGILRNDNELRSFMENIKSALFGPLGDLGVNLSDIGITSDSDYNKQGQIVLDEEKFKKALEENGDLVYKATTAAFEKIKDVTYKYAGSSAGLFVKKAGMEKTSTAVNNLFSEQIRKQEQYIKDLTTKMQKKESQLYAKFAKLESNMSKLNSQMNYLLSELS